MSVSEKLQEISQRETQAIDNNVKIAEHWKSLYDAGKKAEYDAFWDIIQNHGNRTNYYATFAFAPWDDITFKPKYDIKPSGSMADIFRSSSGNGAMITDLEAALERAGVAFDTSQVTSFNNAFNNRYLTTLPVLDASKSTTVGGFNSAFGTGIKTIRKLICSANTVWSTLMFYGPMKLENIIIEGVIGKNDFNVQSCSYLTHDSLMSIINALQDKTGDTSGTAWIVTLGATNKAKLTEEELLIAYNKGWEVQ